MDQSSASRTPFFATLRFAATLFFAFFRLGLTAFGGPAMVAYIRELAITKNQWVSEASFQQGVAICQVIPGATAMQVAAYVGLRACGPLGAMMAYIGFGLPAFLLMVVLAALYQSAHDQATIVAIFKGLQVIVIALVANAALNFGQSTIKHWPDAVLGFGVTTYLVMQGNPVVAILVAAVFGIFFSGKKQGSPAKSSVASASVTLAHLKMPILLTLALLLGMVLLYLSNRPLFDLCLVMVKVDLFAFGGGYGSIPLMFNEVVGVRQWLDGKTFMDGIVLGQLTPGPIVITATFVGYLVAFLPGAVVGTVGIFTPSLIMLTAAAPCFDRIQNNSFFQRSIHGVLVSFVGLLVSVTIGFMLTVPWSVLHGVLGVLGFVALRMKVDILWVVFVGAILSALVL